MSFKMKLTITALCIVAVMAGSAQRSAAANSDTPKTAFTSTPAAVQKTSDPKEKALVNGVKTSDGNTAALWLFDEFTYPHTTLTDASEYAKADLCLMNGGKMVEGKFGNALQVSGSDYAICYAGFAGKVPQEELRGPDGVPSGLWGPTEGPESVLGGLAGKFWTIELWINLDSIQSDISIIDMGQGYDGGLSLIFKRNAFELVNNYAGVKAVCPAKLSAGKWHNAAFCSDGKSVRLFLDGIEQAGADVSSIPVQPIPDLQKPKDREHESRGFEKMEPEQQKLNRFNIAVGSDRHMQKLMKGMIDEIRISRVARYSGNFTPASFSKNFGADAPMPAVANGQALLFNPKPISIPLEFGLRKHVFIDDAIIETKENVQMTMNQPFGKQPLGLDFEIKKSAWRPSVFAVKDQIFMPIPESYSSNEGLTLLAISGDGLSFKKYGKIIPETPMYGAFFKDLNPNIPADELYKVNSFVANRGMYFYTSPDGLNWRRNETIQLPLASGGEGECYWDDQRGVYVSFIKRDSSFRTKEYPGIGPKGHKAIMFETNELLKPWPFKAIEKPWYEGWPFPAVTGEGETVFTAQKYGWVYRTRAIKYPWAPDVYLAFIWRYPGNDRARHVELAVSRNGKDWKLFGTNWYIPTGTAEEEIAMYGLIRQGKEIWQYVDEGSAHGGSGKRSYYRYTQRLDGFVSLDAGNAVGTATTLPLKFEGSKLILNINATNSAKVAIMDENGKEMPGFGLADCDEIKGDFIDKAVKWKGNSNVNSLSGKTVRVKFQMQNAKLYAFEFSTRVLIIGDSISQGYLPHVKKLLKGKAQVEYPNVNNCESTAKGLVQLDDWLGGVDWDVIHFNFGLHDMKYVNDNGEKTSVIKGKQNVLVDQYEKNLEELVIRLKKTGAKLIFATTTPVPDGAGGRVAGDEVKYNKAAVKIMAKHGITVDDLCGFALPRLGQIQRPRNVHFIEPQGCEVLAKQVADYISKAL